MEVKYLWLQKKLAKNVGHQRQSHSVNNLSTASLHELDKVEAKEMTGAESMLKQADFLETRVNYMKHMVEDMRQKYEHWKVEDEVTEEMKARNLDYGSVLDYYEVRTRLCEKLR